jgi:hypothetical protein
MMRNTLPPLASNDLFGVVARGAENAKSNSPCCERKAKQTEHEEDARTPYESTAWIETPILPVKPSHFRRVPPELAELVTNRQLLIDRVNHRGNGIIGSVTESARAEEERRSQDQPYSHELDAIETPND